MARRSNLSEDELDSLKVTRFSGHSHTARFISCSSLLKRFMKHESKQYESFNMHFSVSKIFLYENIQHWGLVCVRHPVQKDYLQYSLRSIQTNTLDI